MFEFEANIKIILSSDSVSSMLKKVAELLKEKHIKPWKQGLHSKSFIFAYVKFSIFY